MSPNSPPYRQKILETVYDACVEVLHVDRAALDESTSFAADLDADSLALVEIVMVLEERLDLSIPEDDLTEVTTVRTAVDLVAARLDSAA